MALTGHKNFSQYSVTRLFYLMSSTIFGIKVVVKNPEALKTRPAVFISNHQAELDILVLGAIFPPHTSVTAKKDLKYWPILGQFMTLSGAVFVDRVNKKNALKAFEGATEQIKENKSNVFIYPEGTRSRLHEPGFLPFKKGAFHLAVQAGIPIVPAVVSNYSRIFDLKKKMFGSGKIEIEVLEPIPTKGLTAADVNDLVQKARTKMIEACLQLGYGDGVPYKKKEAEPAKSK